jgi:hypothetical protein
MNGVRPLVAATVAFLPKDFSVGLRAYGHTLPSTSRGTCGDSALVHSILQTPGDLKPVGGGTVILITDGEESCKGDFAAAAKALADTGLNLTVARAQDVTLRAVIAGDVLAIETP